MYLVEEFYKKHGVYFGLELIAGEPGLKRQIKLSEVHQPGLSLAGYLKGHVNKRILIFGKAEIEYLKEMPATTRIKRLDAILTKDTPALIVAKGSRPNKELQQLCEMKEIPLFRAGMATIDLLNKLTILLSDEFAKSETFHATFIEVFGVGILIKGDSSVGKSEAALGLIEKGHHLISDDIVKIKRKDGNILEGSGSDLTKHHMEIRGIGIINIAQIYGAVSVRNSKSIDIVVELEHWKESCFYDRAGLDEKYCDILGIKLPYHILPVKPGRDIVLLLETLALNHRLKGMGCHSAKEFKSKLLEKISEKNRRKP